MLRHKTTAPDDIERAYALGLNDLGSDYIDIFYLHNFSPASITDELLTRRQLMRQRDMFRPLGINAHSEAHMRYIAGLRGFFDVAIMDFNLAQPDRLLTVDHLHMAGVAAIVATVLAQGHLIRALHSQGGCKAPRESSQGYQAST